MDALDYKTVFERVPGCHILEAANAPRFTIEGVSDSYTEATFINKNLIIGEDFFWYLRTTRTTVRPRG